ncbi:MAG: hypothetical protein AAB381_01975 [Patescibacteria group bacterium]
MNKWAVTINKNLGETPLEALERFRAEQIALGRVELADVPMTYAGRLDPMAEGKLLILIGEECKQKEKYLGLDKTYEVEVLFGIETDTYDILGLAKIHLQGQSDKKVVTSTYIGTFTQTYPPYSSKTVDGKQLHTLARADELPEELPTKEVEIYSIEKLEDKKISAPDLLNLIQQRIALVKGDFRQKEIFEKWNEVLAHSVQTFPVIKLKVTCSSGTYMRSLAQRIGKEMGMGACALSIKRTEIVGI